MKTTFEILKETIHKRRSDYPKNFTGEQAIDRNRLLEILELANRAPTHKRTEPWRFKVLFGAKKEELGHFLAKKYTETQAPELFKPKKVDSILAKAKKSACVIAIFQHRDLAQRIPEWEETAAVAMAVQNIWLGCTASNLASYWSSPKLIRFAPDFFDLKENETCLGFLYVGHIETPLAPTRRISDIADKIEWME